ncbi:MAG: hypothetical protein LBG44_00655 [Gemmatimonadota bacterium]|nr:hypothetical protein [Gemmatimonadota bacterium]
MKPMEIMDIHKEILRKERTRTAALVAGGLFLAGLAAVGGITGFRYLARRGNSSRIAGDNFAERTSGAGNRLEEPVLGYDGMDQETLLEWLQDAYLGDDELMGIAKYERATLDREPVLAMVDDLLG